MKNIKKHLKWITLTIVMIIFIAFLFIKYNISSNAVDKAYQDEIELNKEEDNLNKEDKKEEKKTETIFVDAKGAVANPGVYEIDSDKKVIDVINLAGGLTENADTTMVNLAKKVANEMVIIIYTKEEVRKALEADTIAKVVDKQCVCPNIKNDACLNQGTSKDKTNTASKTDNTKTDNIVNINTAPLEELLTINGIGESKAKAIIEYREEHGNFKQIKDIMEVSGIGESLYEKIKDHITV